MVLETVSDLDIGDHHCDIIKRIIHPRSSTRYCLAVNIKVYDTKVTPCQSRALSVNEVPDTTSWVLRDIQNHCCQIPVFYYGRINITINNRSTLKLISDTIS